MKKALSFYLFEDTEEFLCHGDNFNHLKLAYQNNTLMSKLGIDPLVNSCKNAFFSLFFVNNYILYILKRFEVFCVNIYRIHNLQRPESKSAYEMYPFIGFVGIYKKKNDIAEYCQPLKGHLDITVNFSHVYTLNLKQHFHSHLL